MHCNILQHLHLCYKTSEMYLHIYTTNLEPDHIKHFVTFYHYSSYTNSSVYRSLFYYNNAAVQTTTVLKYNFMQQLCRYFEFKCFWYQQIQLTLIMSQHLFLEISKRKGPLRYSVLSFEKFQPCVSVVGSSLSTLIFFFLTDLTASL